jgi:hypothetical protein
LDELIWKKDKTSYLVFSCKKCHQFSYVQLTQKSKKCLRCGYTHNISSIIPRGEIVLGITNAHELVKKMQEKLKGTPQFEAANSFKIAFNGLVTPQNPNKLKKGQENALIETQSYFLKLKKMLLELGTSYKSFPRYLIEIMADECSIPKKEIPRLLRTMIKQKLLGHSEENGHYFFLN